MQEEFSDKKKKKKDYTIQFVTKPGALFQYKAAENCVSLLH